MKVVALVPVKLNNERLPGKNLKRFTNGEPLISCILKTLSSIDRIQDTYVFCSDEEVCNYLMEPTQFLKRSADLDSSNTKINEIITAFIEQVDADIYILSHVTSPFISKDSINKGLELVLAGDYDSALSVKKIQDFLWIDGKPINYDLSNIPRTQDLKPIYKETSGFYIFTKEVFLSASRRIGNKPFLVEVSEIESIDIDDLEDFELADAIFNYNNRIF